MITAVVLALIGWPGLLIVLTSTLPTLGPRWLFFFLLTCSATGTALPFVWLLHKRFNARSPAPSYVLLRQGLWIGLYCSVILWLQINRNVNLTLAIMLALALAGIEWFVRLLERSIWRPQG
jgi:hypothetical protein